VLTFGMSSSFSAVLIFFPALWTMLEMLVGRIVLYDSPPLYTRILLEKRHPSLTAFPLFHRSFFSFLLH
jgi:hypothetical protein